MLRPRVIPVLLLSDSGLVKTEGFKTPRYIGDPINALRVFNEKEVDEVVVLDISATQSGQGPDFARIADLASECFMPMAYGGGVRSPADAERLFAAGVEKIVVGAALFEHPELVRTICQVAGAQSVVACLDVRSSWLGRRKVWIRSGTVDTGFEPIEAARKAEGLGVGEIIIQSIDHDGRREGYDLELIRQICAGVQVPVVACGGAGKLSDLQNALACGASAAAAGSLFVLHGKHRAVLITYPKPGELESIFPHHA